MNLSQIPKGSVLGELMEKTTNASLDDLHPVTKKVLQVALRGLGNGTGAYSEITGRSGFFDKNKLIEAKRKVEGAYKQMAENPLITLEEIRHEMKKI